MILNFASAIPSKVSSYQGRGEPSRDMVNEEIGYRDVNRESFGVAPSPDGDFDISIGEEDMFETYQPISGKYYLTSLRCACISYIILSFSAPLGSYEDDQHSFDVYRSATVAFNTGTGDKTGSQFETYQPTGKAPFIQSMMKPNCIHLASALSSRNLEDQDRSEPFGGMVTEDISDGDADRGFNIGIGMDEEDTTFETYQPIARIDTDEDTVFETYEPIDSKYYLTSLRCACISCVLLSLSAPTAPYVDDQHSFDVYRSATVAFNTDTGMGDETGSQFKIYQPTGMASFIRKDVQNLTVSCLASAASPKDMKDQDRSEPFGGIDAEDISDGDADRGFNIGIGMDEDTALEAYRPIARIDTDEDTVFETYEPIDSKYYLTSLRCACISCVLLSLSAPTAPYVDDQHSFDVYRSATVAFNTDTGMGDETGSQFKIYQPTGMAPFIQKYDEIYLYFAQPLSPPQGI